jgi:hypothetical protein
MKVQSGSMYALTQRKLNVRSVLSPSACNATRVSGGEEALIQNDGDVASVTA